MVLLLLIVIGIYWKLTLTSQYTWLNSGDFAYQVLPWYQFEAAQIQQGHIPLWDPHEWGGQPLIGQLQPGLQYPPNWLLFLMPLPDGYMSLTAMHWYFVLIHYLGALFCFFLCRDLKLSFAASILAGGAFALGGFFGATDWPQILNGAIWAPLVILFLLRSMRGERPLASAALAGTFNGIAFLSGHHQMPFYILLSAAGLWIYDLAASPSTVRGQRFRAAAIFGVFLVLVSGLQTLPALEYGRVAERWIGSVQDPVTWRQKVPYTVHAQSSIGPGSLAGIVLAGMNVTDTFMGIVVFSLALFAVASRWADRTVRIFAALALAGLLYAMGSSNPFHGILYGLVPLVEKARVTLRVLVIFNLGIAVLSAYGLDAFRDAAARESSAWAGRLIRALLAFALLIWVVLLGFSMVRVQPAQNYNWIGMTALIALLLAAALQALRMEQISQKTAAAIVVLLMLLDIGMITTFRMASRESGWPLVDSLYKHQDIVRFLKSQPGPVRVEMDNTAIPYNFGDWHGIDAFESYLASITRNLEFLRGEINARMLWGINYYIGAAPERPERREVFTGKSGLKVFANPDAFPRVWTVHHAGRASSPVEILSRIRKPLAELRSRTFVPGDPPALEDCGGEDDASILSQETNTVSIDADLKCRGMVVLGDTFFPGWKATVDGTTARIHEAYGALRGVVVERGRHRIEMRYRPASVWWGAVMTFAGLLAACLVAATKRAHHFKT